MAFTRVVGAGIHTAANINSHNIKSTGIITATKFDGPFDTLNVTGVTTFSGDTNFGGNVSIAGTLTYEDVTNVDSVGILTARSGLKVLAGGANIVGVVTATTFKGDGDFVDIDVDGHTDLDNVSVAGVSTFASTVNAATINATLFNGASQVGIQSGGVQIGAGITQLNFIGTGNTFAVNGTTVDVSIQGGGAGAGGTWSTYTAGIATTKSVGVNTNNLDDNDLVGVGNSFQGLYISNGMMITDNKLSGNHYIGTAFNGLMAGPVTVEGTLTIDGNYVVV